MHRCLTADGRPAAKKQVRYGPDSCIIYTYVCIRTEQRTDEPQAGTKRTDGQKKARKEFFFPGFCKQIRIIFQIRKRFRFATGFLPGTQAAPRELIRIHRCHPSRRRRAAYRQRVRRFFRTSRFSSLSGAYFPG